MELSKLEPFIGHSIKNYKEMCNILGEDKKNGGKSKVAQLKEWERYFKYQREGHKFKIIEIYDEVLPKKDGRKLGNNSKYVSSIELILIDFLLKQKDNNYVLTKKHWFSIIGMVNKNYLDEKYIDYLFGIGISKFYINDFIRRSKNKLDSILFTSLDNMKRRNLLEYVQQVVIKPIVGNYFIADKKQEKQIIDVQQVVLVQMGYQKIGDLLYKGLMKEFFKNVEAELKTLYDWKGYYKQYDLTYLGNRNTQNVTDDFIKNERKQLNINIINALNDYAEKHYKKQCEDFEEWEQLYTQKDSWINVFDEDKGDFSNIPKKPFKYKNDYIIIQKELCDKLIRI